MQPDLLIQLTTQCRARPLDQPQRDRIALHMRACGVRNITERGLLFELDGQLLKVLRLPHTAGGEPTLV